MRKLFWQISSSLDGFMEGPNHDLSHTAGIIDEDFEHYASAMLQSIDGFVVGRRTYDLFASYWPKAEGADAERLNTLPKLVASRSPKAIAWSNARLTQGDASESVAAWKREAGRDLALFGSSDLAASLMQRGLIDELRLLVTPFILGAGGPTFKSGQKLTAFKLENSEQWSSGTIFLTYAKA